MDLGVLIADEQHRFTLASPSSDLDSVPLHYETNCPYYREFQDRPCIAPKFRLRERFPDGAVYIGDSLGDWAYIDDGEVRPCSLNCRCRRHDESLSEHFTFAVCKAHDDPCDFIVKFYNGTLLSWLVAKSNIRLDARYEVASMNGLDLLCSYLDLKKALRCLDPSDSLSQHAHLLVDGFLADGEAFKSFGYEYLYRLGALKPDHWLEFQNYRVQRDITILDKAYQNTVNSPINKTTQISLSLDSPNASPIPDSSPPRPVSNYCIQVPTTTGIDLTNHSTLETSAWDGDQRTVQLLLDRGAGIDNDRALEGAAKNGHEGIVWLLLNHGASADNYYALWGASKNGHEGIVRLLLDRGASVNNYGALWDASENGHEGIVRLLLEHGASAGDGNALQYASKNGHEGIVRLLLNHGVRVDNGVAVQYASKNGHEGIVRLLLDYGARADNNAALWYASDGGHKSIVQLLLEHKATDIDHSLWGAAKDGDIGIIRLILERQPDLGSDYAKRALVKALRDNDSSVARALLDYGVNLDVEARPVEPDIRTIVLAALSEDTVVLRFLLDNYRKLCTDQQLPSTDTVTGGETANGGLESLEILKSAREGNSVVVWRLLNQYIGRNSTIPLSRRQRAVRLLMKEGYLARTKTFSNQFKNQYMALLQAAKRSSTKFSRFPKTFPSHQEAWKTGIHALRRLCNGKRLQDLDGIIAFLCIAWSISLTLDEDGDHTFHSNNFRRDLARWKSLIPDEDHNAFEDSVIALCGGCCNEISDHLDADPDDQLGYLQRLARSLVGPTSRYFNLEGCSDDGLESSQQRWKFRKAELEAHAETRTMDGSSSSPTQQTSATANAPSQLEKCNKPRLKGAIEADQHLRGVDMTVAALMAGIAFISVLQFLVWLRMATIRFAWGSIVNIEPGLLGGWDEGKLWMVPADSLKDRVQVLEAYLGLEQTPQEISVTWSSWLNSNEYRTQSPDITTSLRAPAANTTCNYIERKERDPTAKVPLQYRFSIADGRGKPKMGDTGLTCPDCVLDFSTRTNFLRHQRERHEGQKYICQQCCKEYSRKDYQKRHKCRSSSGAPAGATSPKKRQKTKSSFAVDFV